MRVDESDIRTAPEQSGGQPGGGCVATGLVWFVVSIVIMVLMAGASWLCLALYQLVD